MIEASQYGIDENTYVSVEGDLNELLEKLKPGMCLNGRVIEELGKFLFILRIRGYNMVMESEYDFNRFDEIQLVVRQIEPDFQLELLPRQPKFNPGQRISLIQDRKTDITVF